MGARSGWWYGKAWKAEMISLQFCREVDPQAHRDGHQEIRSLNSNSGTSCVILDIVFLIHRIWIETATLEDSSGPLGQEPCFQKCLYFSSFCFSVLEWHRLGDPIMVANFLYSFQDSGRRLALGLERLRCKALEADPVVGTWFTLVLWSHGQLLQIERALWWLV